MTSVFISLRDGEKLKGLASVTFNGCFLVRGFAIIDSPSAGLFVANPSRLRPQGYYADICDMGDFVSRKWFEDAILSEYHRVRETKGKQP